MHPPPCSGFRGLSWGCAVLQGHKRAHLGRTLVAPDPYGVFTPRGHSASAPSRSRSCGRPFMDFRSSSELDHRDPAPSRRLPGKSDDTSSPGLLLPYDTVSNRRIRLPAADPSATACHVRGLATPFATYTTSPPDATSASEHPWASPFKGFPSLRSVPLSEPVPSCRYRAATAPPRRAAHTTMADFKALFPQRVRADAGTTSGSSRRSLLEIHPSRAFSCSTWRSL